MWLKTKAKVIFNPYNITTKHNNQSSWKKVVIASINDDLDLYYSWFVQRRYFPSAITNFMERPIRNTHFTIINDRIVDEDVRIFEKLKSKWDKKYIDIEYNINVCTDATYWWLRCRSNDATTMRNELNIGKPYFDHHITIGVVQKPAMLIHSKYIYKLIKEGRIEN